MPRRGHAAVLLLDGRVLIVGGYSTKIWDYPTVAETYDPATGTFAPVGALAEPRAGLVATRLADGRVLVTGGYGTSADDQVDLASTEIFDPATGAFSAGPPMTRPRRGHTATLLADGRVLVAGGGYDPDEEGDGWRAAEIFDPVLGTFTPTSPMTAFYGRAGHDAVRLADGRVLLAGGSTAPSVDDAELFDPASGAFVATAGMLTPRSIQNLTLLADGRALVSGGSWDYGGIAAAFTEAEVYEPTSGSFVAVGDLPRGPGRGATATALADGRVLTAGGRLGVCPIVFDPTTATFSELGAAMTVERQGAFTATRLLDGTVLFVGGRNGTGMYVGETDTAGTTAELFVPGP
jgi:hypothetical protein